MNVNDLSPEDLTKRLTYIGFILITYELTKNLIIEPIKTFYQNVSFAEGLPWKSYNEDVKSRHKNEILASLLYLQHHMKVIDSEDFTIIQEFRKHRNYLAHEVLKDLITFDLRLYIALLEKVDKVLLKLSNYQAYMDVGAEPELKGRDWSIVKGHEYLLFKEILKKIKISV